MRAMRVLGLALSLILLSRGAADTVPDGSYRAVEMIPVGEPQTWALISDFNRDGTDDFLFVLLSGDEIPLFLSEQDGAMRAPRSPRSW